jgi:ribosomal subunit interface protein
MNINISCRNFKLTPQAKIFLLESTDQLKTYFRSILTVDWTLEFDRYQFSARCRIHARSGRYMAGAKAKTIREAGEMVIDKIERQRRRAKKIKTSISRHGSKLSK